jgi:hypothetical protein
MRQALDALETLARYENPETRIQVRKPKDGGPIVTMYPHKVASDAATALRAAIEQADPTLWYHSVSGRVRFDGAGLGRNWVPLYTAPQSINDFKPDWDTVKAYDEKFAEMLDEQQRLRAELKQTKRQWVGLTDEEMNAAYRQAFGLIDSRMVGDQVKFVRAIEAKLKEKNT